MGLVCGGWYGGGWFGGGGSCGLHVQFGRLQDL